MGFGDSLLLSMNGTSRISCALAIENGGLATSAQGNLRGFAPRVSSCRVILGGLPSLEERTARNGSRKRFTAIRASKSGSVDSPEFAASTSTSLGPQAQSHLNLLERMTENSTASQAGDDVKTIRDQLASQIEPEAEEVVVSLVSEEKEPTPPQLTISQKRNIRRQNYLNKVSERNDAPFFATVAGFVLLPPLLILGFAVATGYIELFP